MPPGVIIVGLGPGDREYWTLEADQILSTATEVYLRTVHHPSTAAIVARTHSFDSWYEANGDLETTHHRIAAEIVGLGQRPAGVIYAVPGHPAIGQATVSRIQTLAATSKLPVRMVAGLSPIEPALTALGIDRSSQLQIAEAAEIAANHHPALEPDRPALITMLHGRPLAARIKRTLLNAYSDKLVVTLIQAAGTDLARTSSCQLGSLDGQIQLNDQLTMLYLPADISQGGFSTLQETIAHLRAPHGCPWDREQTHQTLRPFLIEETYEVLEALDSEDPAALAEELGDLLLQVVLHTQIAIDTGEFKMGEVIDHINRKLRRRHPHVFGEVVVNGVSEVTTNWEAIKQAEKAAKGQSGERPSTLDGIPAALPALAQALAVSNRAVRVGFEWPDIEGIMDKIIEEAREISEAADPRQLEAEIGDLLFSVVNLARWQQVDPESALRATNARFSRRFRHMEQAAALQGRRLTDLTLDEMENLWTAAKRQEQ